MEPLLYARYYAEPRGSQYLDSMRIPQYTTKCSSESKTSE